MVDEIIGVIKKEVTLLDRSGDKNAVNQLSKLKRLIKYLENDIELDDREFKELFIIISSLNDISEHDKKEILLKFGFYYWMKHDHSKEEFEFVDENSKPLDINDIENLWRDFGFSEEFIKILETEKYDKYLTTLIKYSKFDKIKGILDLFKENGIVPSDFESLKKQFLQILIHSDVNVIKELFEYINEDILSVGRSLSFNKRFHDYVSSSSLFGGRTRVYIKREKKSSSKSNTSSIKSDFTGTFLKFKENREFLKKMGVEIKLDCLTTLQKSHEIIKKNYFLLRKYGFENEDIENSLSVLSAVDLEYHLDLAVELRILDRFKINPSHLVSFNTFIPRRIKYCREKNISIDGLRKGELSSKIMKKSSIFDAEKNGPETRLENKSEKEITYDPKSTKMITEYDKLIGIERSTPLLVSMIESDIDIDDIDDIEYEHTDRKQYLKSIIDEFDRCFAIDQYQYVFTKGYEKVVISRLKVRKNLARLLYNEFVDAVQDLSFDYISNILIHCIEKKSLLTRNEQELIESSVYDFIDEFNKKNQYSNFVVGLGEQRHTII